jgi:hypothetical protein
MAKMRDGSGAHQSDSSGSNFLRPLIWLFAAPPYLPPRAQLSKVVNAAVRPSPDIENHGCKPRLLRPGVCFQWGLGAGPRSNRG